MYKWHFWHFQLPVRKSPPSSSRGAGGRCRDPGFPASAGYWRASAPASPHRPECYSSAPRGASHHTLRMYNCMLTFRIFASEWCLKNKNSLLISLLLLLHYNKRCLDLPKKSQLSLHCSIEGLDFHNISSSWVIIKTNDASLLMRAHTGWDGDLFE